MSKLEIDKIGLKVGLEIHQQLSTNKKLFCNCSSTETDEFTFEFSRKLRASKSELGKYDPAAIFESTKSKKMIYYSNSSSCCLVEQDEEPPHELDSEAKKLEICVQGKNGYSKDVGISADISRIACLISSYIDVFQNVDANFKVQAHGFPSAKMLTACLAHIQENNESYHEKLRMNKKAIRGSLRAMTNQASFEQNELFPLPTYFSNFDKWRRSRSYYC